MILLIFNNGVDLISILALVISLIALVSTLRKKEFGKFYYIPINESKSDIWIKLIKNNIYDLNITCESYEGMSSRINIYCPDGGKDTVFFIDKTSPKFELASLKENSIIKFRNCNSNKFKIRFRDRYNNLYSQNMTQKKINERHHKNFWNLTFVGT